MRKFCAVFVFLVLGSALFAQQALNNDGVIKLIKSGLSEDLVVSTINGSPGTYDTSANSLVELKAAGASDKVVAAIFAKTTGSTASSAPAGSALPSGIDEVGIYYKDKSGAWTALMPEIVNFKTGGVLKSFATNGIVKGDVNGHLEGEHAKLSITFPVVLAVYVSEGTAITEYQVLRLRKSGKSREFRSVTGGVVHGSSGAKRDSVEFTSTKIAPRLYQITLNSDLGKGEYGLLPPGAVNSSNMASGGKIYSVTIPE